MKGSMKERNSIKDMLQAMLNGSLFTELNPPEETIVRYVVMGSENAAFVYDKDGNLVYSKFEGEEWTNNMKREGVGDG